MSRTALLFYCLAALTARADNPSVGASQLVVAGSPEASRFSAVGRFSNCTGSAVRFPGSSDSTPAYLLTAGHCNDLSSTDIILDRPDTSRNIVFRYWIDQPASNRPAFRTRRILYSTMKATDFALIELDATVGALRAAGITPLSLSASATQPGEPAEWAGVPSNSTPSDEVYLRTSECTVSGITDLIEWRWLWRDMLRHDCSDIFGGASGSPLISRRSGMVIGVITTSNVGWHDFAKDVECWRDNPCEARPDGYVYRPDTSYAAPVAALAGCHDANGVFSLTAGSCGLDPGVQARVQEIAIRAQPGSKWNTSVASDTLKYFRYKVAREGSADCRTEDGYGAAIPITAETRITDPMPSEPGRYHLCVVAGTTPTVGDSWQPARFATVVHVTIDDTPPEHIPEFVLLENSVSFAFIPSYFPPDISLVMPKVESSPDNNCADRTGYRMAFPVPYALPADATRLCLIAVDLAGNQSEPYAIELKRPSIFRAGVTSSAGQEISAAAPGAWITIKGVNLAAKDATTLAVIRDASGRRWDVAPAYASSGQLNLVIPPGVSPGDAAISAIVGDQESNSIPVTVAATLPGLFTPNGVRYGTAAVSVIGPGGETKPAFTCSLQFCAMEPIPAGSRLVFVAGGLTPNPSIGDLSVQLSGVPLNVVDVSPTSALGTVSITTTMPNGFILRGYLPATLVARGKVSTPVYVWLR